MTTLQLKPKEHHRIAAGHLWVFRDELVTTPDLPAGTAVNVVTHEGASLGTGLYNKLSKITVRMLATTETTIDTKFIVERIRAAQALREQFLPNEEGYRVLFGESDLMSGLIIDRYKNTMVIQMLSAGMDVRKAEIIEAIRDVFPEVTGIVEKNQIATRKKEGLELTDGVVWGTVPESIQFTENGIKISVDLVTGQKTGYFLDQKINRQTAAAYSKNKRVLDCFCNVGGFALNAAAAGATLAVGIDSSEIAVANAQKNAELNNFSNCEFIKANVFDYLREQAEAGETWDMVILDPPSFAKSRTAIRGAVGGYAELNRTAMKLLRPGGILITASCTQLVPEHDLMDIVYRESARLRVRLRLMHRGGQSPDHPTLLAMPETHYLKFLVFSVM